MGLASNVHNLLGVLVVSTWANTALFIVELIWAIRYFRTFMDGIVIKMLVSLCLFSDVMCTAAEYATVYLDAITHFGDLTGTINPNPAARTMYIVPTFVNAFLVQAFLIYRIWKLSNSLVAFVFLGLVSLFALGGGVALIVRLSTFTKITDRAANVTVTVMWLATSAILDIIIAIALLLLLNYMRQHSSFNRTRTAISKLMTLSVQTGAITAGIASSDCIFFVFERNTNLNVMLTFLLGRAYSITLLYNLNQRAALNNGKTTDHTSGVDSINLSGMRSPRAIQSGQRSDFQGPNASNNNYGIKIQVDHSAVSRMDEGFKSEFV